MTHYEYYYLGTVVKVTGTFATDDVAVDPTNIYFKYADPSGNATTCTYGDGNITRAGTGEYYSNISTDEGGIWKYRFWSTGSGQAAAEGRFTVRSTTV